MTADYHRARAQRAHLLRARGMSHAVAEELLAYADNGLPVTTLDAPHQYPLDDEPFVDAWDAYAQRAAVVGTVAVLRESLVQLRFPIESGMSGQQEYMDATRRGIMPANSALEPVSFANPEAVHILLHQTPAGRLPVVLTGARADFELLVRALTRHNEPRELPATMGACIIGGYNNWARLNALRAEWTGRQINGSLADLENGWQRELRRIIPCRELYQDRFVVLSAGPYSDTPAEALALSDEEWLRMSLIIRLEHECTHYFTRRVFGFMRNSLLDELIADYTGIVAARGRFEPIWLLRFMGVETDRFRATGRLTNYRGTPPLGDEAFHELQELVRAAARSLGRFDELVRGGIAAREVSRTNEEVAACITVITDMGLERLTSAGAADAMHESYMRKMEASGALAMCSS